MGSESERLEREAEDLRRQLQGTIEELQRRLTLARAVDQVIDLARHGPAKEFFADLANAARRNPIPLALIGIGVAWLALASRHRRRPGIDHGAAATVLGKAGGVDFAGTDAVTGVAAVETEAWPPAASKDGTREFAELDGASNVVLDEEASPRSF